MESLAEPEKEPDDESLPLHPGQERLFGSYLGGIVVREIPRTPPEIYEGNPETTDLGW